MNLSRDSQNGLITYKDQWGQTRLISAGSLNLIRDSQNGLITGTSLNDVDTVRSYNGFVINGVRVIVINGVRVIKKSTTLTPLNF